jgi:hypothetical protein
MVLYEIRAARAAVRYAATAAGAKETARIFVEENGFSKRDVTVLKVQIDPGKNSLIMLINKLAEQADTDDE